MKSVQAAPLRSSGLLMLALAGSLALGACNRQEDPAQTAQDMGEERREGNQDVQDAARDAAENRAEGADSAQQAGDAYTIEMEKIEADHEVAKERCDGVPPEEKSACIADADAAYESAKKAAEAKRDSREDGGMTPMTP